MLYDLLTGVEIVAGVIVIGLLLVGGFIAYWLSTTENPFL